METNTYIEIERKISVKDLLKYVSTKCKLIVVCTIIFAIVFGVLGVVVQSVNNNKEIDVEALKEELTEQELSDIEYCKSVDIMLHQSMDYYNDSVLMNSDLNNIVQGEIIYYAQVDNIDLSNDVVNMYIMKLSSQEMYEAIQKDLENQVSVKDLDEMIDYSYLGAYAEKAGGVFSVLVKAPTQEMYTSIANVIKENIEKDYKGINIGIISHELKILSESVEVNVDETLINKKYELLTNIDKLESQRDSLKDSFSATAQDVYADWEAKEYPEKEEEEDSIVVVLFVAIGVVLGIFLPLCYIVASYLLNGKVKTARELRDYYGIHNLANLKVASNKECDSVASRIALACKNNNISKICLVKPENEKCSTGIDYVARAIETKGIKVKLVENPVADGASLEECNAIKNVLLWVKLWDTKEADVVELLKASKAYGFEVMGYISETA